MSNKKKLLIGVIPLLAVIISALILYSAVNKANDIKYGEQVTVQYFNDIGKRIKKMKIRPGFAKPPDAFTPEDNKIFLSWDKDILNIEENMDIHPVCEDIKDTANVIYLNTQYIPNSEKFEAELNLGGIVECNGGSFIIKYDSERLKYEDAKPKKSYIDVTHNADNSTIKIEIEATENITKAVKLADLSFIPIWDGYSYTVLNFELEELTKINEKGELVNTDCSLYHGKIYSY